MEQGNHGRRYSDEEKREILLYLENHTYKETSERYNISETTLARWRAALSQSVSNIKSKIVVGINHFWLDYLNEQISNGVWKDYDDAILQLLRFYRNEKNKSEKKIFKQSIDIDFESLMKKIDKNNQDISDFLVIFNGEIVFKSKTWPSDVIKPLIDSLENKQEEKNPLVLYNNRKFIKRKSKDQIIFTGVAATEIEVPAKVKELEEEQNIGKHEINEVVSSVYDSYNVKKEYICGKKIEKFQGSLLFFAHFYKPRFNSMETIINFFHSLERVFSEKNR